MRHSFLLTIRKAIIPTAVAAMLGGCVSNPGDTQDLSRRGMDPPVVKSRAESEANRLSGTQTLQVHSIHNTGYIALSDWAVATGYHGAWMKDGRTYGIGDYDVIWSFRTGESTAQKTGRQVRMPAPAVRERGRLLIPASALAPLFADDAVMTSGLFGISVLPRPLMEETGSDGSSLLFSDGGVTIPSAEGKTAANGGNLIGYAMTLMGVPYEFGADPYRPGGTFDCSSFVQHVWDRYGVKLPRSSRQQAAVGEPVSRDELQPGDLLFFNVPSRFKSLASVGHVGIYAGEGRMIHASPAGPGGVQMTDINDPYYLRTFLYAKRVVS